VIEKMLIQVDAVPGHLLSALDNRDVALWIRGLPKELPNQDTLLQFLGLPWRLVMSEWYDAATIAALESATTSSASMIRKRGFVQVVDGDPSRIELPQRSLPFYLLNGREVGDASTDFASRLRRITMLEELRRSNVAQVFVLSADGAPIPPDLSELWASTFRSQLTIASGAPGAGDVVRDWVDRTDGIAAATLLSLEPTRAIQEVLDRYSTIYPEQRRVVRVRDRRGNVNQIDITEVDEPERPILESYSLIEERHLTPLLPQELSEQDFIEFFRNPDASWRPYAAGLPWVRDREVHSALAKYLKRLDSVGAEDNVVAFIASESGAGGTTLARTLAWEVARQGYPVLMAKAVPFIPDALPLTNFLKRSHDEFDRYRRDQGGDNSGGATIQGEEATGRRLYETPWLLVFDSVHWQDRDSELARFQRELEKAGRPVCILVVTSTVLGLSFHNRAVFKEVAELNHAIDQGQALQLGRHLNRFLQVYGKQRTETQWRVFHNEHSVRSLEGAAAFWVTLSFWIQGQYDLTDSIQEWMYRSFKANTDDLTLRIAVLEIAALSSERLPLPEDFLPPPSGPWPVSQLLEDVRAPLASLGLVRIRSDGQKHWALVHDILGRFLINALFYDFPLRTSLGFEQARDAEHLRFLLLRQVAHKPIVGEKAFRPIAEEFATSIFKVDPDHGHGNFTAMWRDMLEALDTMPRTIRDTSRVFRHHVAISRRRIAKLDERFYGVTHDDKIGLLRQAIDDLDYALTMIQYTPGSESNLNLYNSLANAYFDLAKVEAEAGASRERLTELRRLANDATRKAYEESPTNSFVIETYVKNLLQSAEEAPEVAVERCIEALGILFGAISSNEAGYRGAQLGSLADQALAILFRHSTISSDSEPQSAVEVLVRAWTTLTEGQGEVGIRGTLTELPDANKLRALEVLQNPLALGNMQAIRLTFDILCATRPYSFGQQLDLVQQLQATDYRLTPQLRLEYAILLYQNTRAVEGERVFKSLRQLWRESEHFVQVPDRLRWLRTADGSAIQVVNAVAGSDYGNRAMARVQQFGNTLVPFRPEEHGVRELRPGLRFSCHVSFGHNGPFLRPVTAQPAGTRGA
jgi:hypothetical protein